MMKVNYSIQNEVLKKSSDAKIEDIIQALSDQQIKIVLIQGI